MLVIQFLIIQSLLNLFLFRKISCFVRINEMLIKQNNDTWQNKKHNTNVLNDQRNCINC